MRNDPIQFALATTRANRSPRFVIKIEYEVSSIYLTSHSDIPNVPGDVIQAVIKNPSATSQRIYPDDGRSDIGAFTFTAIDYAKQLTASLRAQLQNNGAGLRRKKVKFYLGYKDFDFTQFVLFTTQIVVGASYAEGYYEVSCADITREQKQRIFKPFSTTLAESITAASTQIFVNDTSKFVMVAHGPSYSDAPNATVGYIRIEDEIIRYTSTTPTTFDGCTRGVFNTRAVDHAVDPSTAISRRAKVEEFIYLEMPGPKLAYAVSTGVIYGTANVLPDHWHLGIDTALIKLSDFTGIGFDLWNPSNDNDPGPLIFRFDGLKETDGKRFLEKEVYLLLGCYSPVYADGRLGLKRRVPIISQAASLVTLTQDNIVSMSELVHDFDRMHNYINVLWAYDEIQDDFIRETSFLDDESVGKHGTSERLDYAFRGLHSQRAGDITIAKRLDSLRDAYNEPPQRLSVTVMGSLNGLEVGDVVRVKVPETILRDFVGNAGLYNRSFEIQQRTYDAYTGDVSLELFGSTSRPIGLPFQTNAQALPDAFYSSAGTALGTIIAITGGTAALGSYTLTGASTLGDAGSIFYYLGDLTIPQGCDITIAANVQLRVMGFLTLNGTITGTGNGLAGVTDPGTGAWDATFAGNPGYIGNSRGWDGIQIERFFRAGTTAHSLPAVFTQSKHSVFPQLDLTVSGTSLYGLPDDLRGTGGAPGGRLAEIDFGSAPFVVSAGGAGANGGAGLCIINRGMALGASAQITLDGASPTTPTPVATGAGNAYPGSGGVGGPGSFLLLLDGDTISVPEITSANFSAKTGDLNQPGVYMTSRDQLFNPGGVNLNFPATDSGVQDPSVVDLTDFSAAARSTQYIPATDNPSTEVERPPPPTNLFASHVAGGNLVTWTLPDLSSFDVIEVYASIDNDLTNAVKVGETRSDSFVHSLPLGGLRYYWARSKVNPANGRVAVFSSFEPPSTTGGKSSNADSPGEVPDAPDDFRAQGRTNLIEFGWSLPSFARLLGKLQLWEHTSSTPFSAASVVWEGYALGTTLIRQDTTTRYYWLTLNRSGEQSLPTPNGAGLPAAASVSTTKLHVSFPYGSLVRTATLGPNPRTVILPAATPIVTGGTPPYTYAWSWFDSAQWSTDPYGITIDSPTGSTTTFTAIHNLDGTVWSGAAEVLVTDSLGATAKDQVPIQANFPSVT